MSPCRIVAKETTEAEATGDGLGLIVVPLDFAFEEFEALRIGCLPTLTAVLAHSGIGGGKDAGAFVSRNVALVDRGKTSAFVLAGDAEEEASSTVPSSIGLWADQVRQVKKVVASPTTENMATLQTSSVADFMAVAKRLNGQWIALSRHAQPQQNPDYFLASPRQAASSRLGSQEASTDISGHRRMLEKGILLALFMSWQSEAETSCVRGRILLSHPA